VKFAAFYRNVNLGRPNCPSKAQLEQAFLDAGATEASSFLVNGTLVYAVPRATQAGTVLKVATALLQQRCGLKEPGFVRRVDDLAALVARDPFAGVADDAVYEYAVSFLPAKAPLPPLPLTSRRGDVRVLSATAEGEVFSLCYKIGSSPGSPNALLEKTLAVPATTRAWNTIVRLVAKHGVAADKR
jgi:uncharacterized protein (DUF1697 family)